MTLPLLASILALGIGPLLYTRTRSSWAAAAVDAFALVGVGGLVVVHILPQSFSLAGWLVVPIALVGLLGPGLLCGSRLFAGKNSSRVTMPVALLGIALHALLDGLALTSPSPGDESAALAAAVVLHRLPVGLGIWWLTVPLYGRRAALGLLGAIAIFSVVGFGAGESLVAEASTTWFALFQALVAGSLLHVILRHPPALPSADPHQGSKATVKVASGIGGLGGLALILSLEVFKAPATRGLEEAHTLGGAGGEVTFFELALQSAPALWFAYFAISLMHAWNLDLSKLLGRGGTASQALRGTAAGLPVPICSCGVIPLYRSLVVSGVPTPAAMSFLVATPELGFAALFLSWSLLGGQITLIRAACAAALALAIGILVGRKAPRSAAAEPDPAHEHDKKGPLGERLRKGFSYGFGNMVDGTAPWILAGLLLASVVGGLVDLERFVALPYGLDVPLLALIGLPLYVCASGSTPLAAVLIANGVSPGAAIAFLLTGPATNLTTFGVLAQLHTRRTAIVFGITAILITLVLGWTTNALLPPEAAAGVPERLHRDHSRTFEGLALALLALLFVVSLLRQGTRGFLDQVISPHAEVEYDPSQGELSHHDHSPGQARTETCCEK